MKTVTVTTMPIQFVLTANNAGTISVPIAFDDDIDTVINNLIAALKPLRSDVIILENPSRSHFSDTVVKIHGQNVDLGITITKQLHVPVINARTTVDHSLDEARLAKIAYDKWHVNDYASQIDPEVHTNALSNGMIKIINDDLYLSTNQFDKWQKVIKMPSLTFNVANMHFDNTQWHDYYSDLDMQHGTLTIQYVSEDNDDHHMQVKITKIVDNVNSHYVAIRYELTPLDFDGTINVTNTFSGDGNVDVTDDGINYANNDFTMITKLISSNHIDNNDHQAIQKITITSQQTQTSVIDEIIAINTKQIRDDITFATIKNDNVTYWQKVWQNDLQIDGELNTQKNIHRAIFELQMMNHATKQQLLHEQALTVMPFYSQYTPQQAQLMLQNQQQFIDEMSVTDALAVAYAASDYWQATYDQTFLIKIGLPLILQAAQKCLINKIDTNDIFLYKYVVNVINQLHDQYENEYQTVAQQLQFSDQDWQQLQHQPQIDVDMLTQLVPQEAMLLLWTLSTQMNFKADLSLVIDNYWQNLADVQSLDQALYASLSVDAPKAWSLWQQALNNQNDLATAAVLIAGVSRLYAGISFDKTIIITPHLPQSWQKINGKIMKFGKNYQYAITHYQIQLTTSYDANVMICNQDYLVTPQAPLVMDYAKDPYR